MARRLKIKNKYITIRVSADVVRELEGILAVVNRDAVATVTMASLVRGIVSLGIPEARRRYGLR